MEKAAPSEAANIKEIYINTAVSCDSRNGWIQPLSSSIQARTTTALGSTATHILESLKVKEFLLLATGKDALR